ncbi:DUF3027 domain-containing protein [Gulosibacter sp. 10]|uniref:DUF3027 domain-containing protein n=1 Tax=Gulosibacter sp. 10 TaxID=1255570 RepID=UPI0020CD30C0|nr:DUF3027 domain-containing protein [Gulosibacter sp. 10]
MSSMRDEEREPEQDAPESRPEEAGAAAGDAAAAGEGAESEHAALELDEAELEVAIALARNALFEIAEFEQVGPFHEVVDEGGGVYSLRFESKAPGYPDWWWTVSLTNVDGEQATVLECGLLPAEGALLAPGWVPWAERLATYRATHDEQGNPVSEEEAGAEAPEPEAPRIRTRKRTRTRTRRRGGKAE